MSKNDDRPMHMLRGVLSENYDSEMHTINHSNTDHPVMLSVYRRLDFLTETGKPNWRSHASKSRKRLHRAIVTAGVTMQAQDL